MNRMQRKIKALISCTVVIIICGMLSACQTSIFWVGNNYPGNMEASYMYFDGTRYAKFNAKEGDSISFTYEFKVEKGELSIKIIDPDNETIMELQPNQKGTEKIEIKKDGDYEVVVKGSKAGGSYSIKWKLEKGE
ncbi:hypothetical protein [Anaerobacterium chartisolvens]|nr:hypothetical protein [Anaerobacterium chartisolvens]